MREVVVCPIVRIRSTKLSRLARADVRLSSSGALLPAYCGSRWHGPAASVRYQTNARYRSTPFNTRLPVFFSIGHSASCGSQQHDSDLKYIRNDRCCTHIQPRTDNEKGKLQFHNVCDPVITPPFIRSHAVRRRPACWVYPLSRPSCAPRGSHGIALRYLEYRR